MYFFDIEDYAGTTINQFNADLKGGSGGGGINYCGRPQHFTAYGDMASTANATADAHINYVHRWFTATTVNIGNSTNTLARNIYYNQLLPNWLQYRIDWVKYANQSCFTEKVWESRCVDNKTEGNFTCTSYKDAWSSYATDGSLITSQSESPYTGATTYSCFSANPSTNINTSVNFTIVHPQYNDWNDSYYYNQNNSLRKYMGSLKALMKAIDNDTFEEYTI
jgi:hypothetical protein